MAEALVDLLHGVAPRHDERVLLARVEVALQDEHLAQVVVEARPRPRDERDHALREPQLLVREPVDLRVVLLDLLRHLPVLRAPGRRAAAQGVPDVLGRLSLDVLLQFCRRGAKRAREYVMSGKIGQARGIYPVTSSLYA